VGDVQHYLDNGPGFIFLFHPALGPLWDVIAQKIKGGAVMDGSEMVRCPGEGGVVGCAVWRFLSRAVLFALLAVRIGGVRVKARASNQAVLILSLLPNNPMPTTPKPNHPTPPRPPAQVLEVAEARLVDVTVDGSLLVAADAVMGHWDDQGASCR